MMFLPIKNISVTMSKIDELIRKESFQEAYKEYDAIDSGIKTMKYIVSETNINEREIAAKFYSSYAYFLFSFSEYDQFFEMYIEAQKYGYSFEERRRFIYEAFIEPNIDNLKLNYKTNIKGMKFKDTFEQSIEFEGLPYWLITTGNKNEYYLYEKETDLIEEKISLDINDNKLQDIDLHTSFSDYLIANSDCWNETQDNIKDAFSKRKNCYIVTQNIGKLLSYFQGSTIDQVYLSKLVIFKDDSEFKRYFMNTNNYLPKLIIGSDEEKVKYADIVDEIHKYRLNKDTRIGDNILLSICIPSYNRGKRAYDNVMHTLQSDFDEEIEVILSNNGTQNESKEFYKKISEIEDPRVTYFEFEENQGAALNVCKTVDLAKGKYILLLSDEDLLDLNELQSIVNNLNSRDDNISIIRTKSDIQGSVPFVGMKKPGKDSLFTYMLTSNYISGNIYNKELLVKHDLVTYIKDNLDNNEACLYYPHVVWELVLCQYGNAIGLDNVLIKEGQAEKTELDIATIGINENKDVPYFSTFEGRLGQHKGFYDVIKDLEISKNDFDIFRELYKRLCGKTIFLMSLSIRVYYKETDVNTDELLESAYNDSLKYLEEIYEGKKSRNKYKYKEDIKAINGYYEHYKSQS